jgi:poly(A) polymerase
MNFADLACRPKGFHRDRRPPACIRLTFWADYCNDGPMNQIRPVTLDPLPAAEGSTVYVVGGCLRDILLGREPLDIDIAVRCEASSYARRLARALSGRLVELGKPGKRVYRVVTDRRVYDISGIEGATVEEDLLRRDFTINAIAWDAGEHRIIDCTGGRADLQHATIRMVRPDIFKNDPVRLLRAFRLAADLGFAIEPATMAVIAGDCRRISDSPGERVWAELAKILACPQSHALIRAMTEVGLLGAVVPELQALRGCEQNRHHRFDALTHTLEAYRHLEQLIREPATVLTAPSDRWRRTAAPTALLKFAMLLHDTGKPSTRSVDAGGRVHFYGHAARGADLAAAISRRLRLSATDTAHTVFIIRHHLRPLHLFTAFGSRPPSRRAVTRFFMKCGDHTPDLLWHSLADALGKGPAVGADFEAFAEFAAGLFRIYFEDHRPRSAEPPLLTGRDLILEFGLKPSPLLGTLLTGLEQARLSGALHSRQDAVAWVAEYLRKRQK